MRPIKYVIRLKKKEELRLEKMIRRGEGKARTLTRARVLLFAHRKKSNLFIEEALSISSETVLRIKKRYINSGLDDALYEKARSGKPCVINGRKRAKIIALACSKAPKGRARWSLRLLADKVVELGILDSVSHMGIQKVLKKTN